MEGETSQENAQEWGGPEMALLELLRTMATYMATNGLQVQKENWTWTTDFYNRFALKYGFHQRTLNSLKSKWSKMKPGNNVLTPDVQLASMDLSDFVWDLEGGLYESFLANQTEEVRILKRIR